MSLTIIIEEYEDLRDYETLIAVHIFGIGSARAGTGKRVMERQLRKTPPTAVEVEYHQAWVGVGAGNYWEEALLRFMDAVGSGAAEALVGGFIGWFIGRRKRMKRGLGASSGSDN